MKSTYHGHAPFDFTDLVVNEINIIGSRCGPFSQALDMLTQNRVSVEPLIHSKFAIDQGIEAMKLASTPGTLKVLITMLGQKEKDTSVRK